MILKIKRRAGLLLTQIKTVFTRAGDLFFFYYNYFGLRSPKRIIGNVQGPDSYAVVREGLIRSGIEVCDLCLDLADYDRYTDSAGYQSFPDYYAGGKAPNFKEKSLEHYLAAKLLELSSSDTFIDAACAGSPVSEIYERLYNCTVYRQDLSFKQGLHGNIIGGDACSMPIADGFASRISLHCSFEHFEQDADICFLKEASRVLKKGGRLCIVPLYLAPIYAIKTDPAMWRKGEVSFDPDAVVYCARGWRNRFGRYYDVERFISRIKNNLNDLKIKIYYILNEKEIDPACYVKFVLMLEKE